MTRWLQVSALIASETVNLIIYRGEPDEVRSLEVIDSAWMSVAPSPVP